MGRRVLISLIFVFAAVVLQTTVFAPGRIQLFGAAPNLVLLTVVACARYLQAEFAILLGFTGGLMMDLLGGSPIGLWAITLASVAFVTLRLRDRQVEAGRAAKAAAVFGLTLGGQLVFAVLGTLFGLGVVAASGFVAQTLVLPAVYNVVLAPLVFWGTRVTLRPDERIWAK
jgi:rod shape-determining protein MreD